MNDHPDTLYDPDDQQDVADAVAYLNDTLCLAVDEKGMLDLTVLDPESLKGAIGLARFLGVGLWGFARHAVDVAASMQQDA